MLDGRVSVYPLHTPAHTPPALQGSRGWEAGEGQASPRALEGVRASGRDGQRPDPGHRARGGARSPLCLRARRPQTVTSSWDRKNGLFLQRAEVLTICDKASSGNRVFADVTKLEKVVSMDPIPLCLVST